MAGNSNSGRKPMERRKLDYDRYRVACVSSGYYTQASVAETIDTSRQNVSGWERTGWPLWAYNRLIVALGMNKRQAAARLLERKNKNGNKNYG